MKIKLSDLPPDLRRHVLEQADLPAAAARPRPKSRPLPASSGVLVCTCGTAIFRPDGDYPETCVGCGCRRKVRQTSSTE